MRAKFFCDFFKEPLEVAEHRPNGPYWRIPVDLFNQLPRYISGNEVLLSDTTSNAFQILEFRLTCVGEDDRGQYYHYFFQGFV